MSNNGATLTLGSTQTQADYVSGLQTATNEGALTFGVQSSGAYSESMRIDSSGRIGIGVTPFSAGGNGTNLMVGTDVGAGLTIGATTTGDIQFGDATSRSRSLCWAVKIQHSDDVMAFWTNSSERFYIDSSGNLLVGTSSLFGNEKSCFWF